MHACRLCKKTVNHDSFTTGGGGGGVDAQWAYLITFFHGYPAPA